MSRIRTRTSSLVLMIAFMVLPFLIVACGGGGGENGAGSTAALTVFATSFQGHPTVTGGAIPPALRDETLEITFGGNIDTGIFGGFFLDAGSGQPAVFNGGRELTTGNTVAVPYFAFVDQAAAAQALQVLEDGGDGVTTHPGIIGVHATKPNTVVFDPAVTPNLSTLFNIPISPGFLADTQYDIFIPANSGLTVGGVPVMPFGQLPPVAPPTAANQSIVSTLLRTGPGFLSREAPMVTQITSEYLEMIGGSPGVDDIPYDDTLIIRFSESVDPATVNAQVNFLVRNIDVPLPQQPNGIIVPATLTPDATLREYRVTPTPNFGGGPFQIVVSIEKFDPNDPIEDAKNLKGLPQGAMGVALPIQGAIGTVATATFTTIAQPGEPTVASILEGFDDQSQWASNTPAVPFGGIENVAEWAVVDSMTGLSSSQLRGLTIDGTPIAPNLGMLTPGRRVQYALQPPGIMNPGNPFCTTALCTYSSPFDDNLINNFTAPNGGGRYQAIYVTTPAGLSSNQLPDTITDSFELVEWGTPGQVATPVTYNGFQIRAGHTTRNPVNTGSSSGLDSAWDRNYDLRNPQNRFLQPTAHPVTGDPNYMPNMSPILCFGPAPYFTGTITLNGTFIPFPRLTLPFDYRDKEVGFQIDTGANNVRANPVFEFIVPEPHITNPMTMFVNVVQGTNTTVATPFRRNFGRSSSPISAAKDPVEYHMRFTLAKQLSIATSKFYDTSQANPTYTAFDISPTIMNRPANTRIRIELATKNQSTATVTEADWQTYISFNGLIFPSVLANISGKRYLKVRFTFSSDLLTNTSPYLDGFVVGFSF